MLVLLVVLLVLAAAMGVLGAILKVALGVAVGLVLGFVLIAGIVGWRVRRAFSAALGRDTRPRWRRIPRSRVEVLDRRGRL